MQFLLVRGGDRATARLADLNVVACETDFKLDSLLFGIHDMPTGKRIKPETMFAKFHCASQRGIHSIKPSVVTWIRT